jgi:uncharacterized protein (UPF0335 family)
MTNTPPPPGDPAWADIRARYEAGAEAVDAIARGIGMTRITLAMKALKEGWALRGKRKVAAKARAAPAARRPESTRETLQRLKDMLQKRLTQLEEELQDLGKEVSALNTERGIKSVNTLVRTLEKVIDLERNEKLKRRQDRAAHQYFDDEQRRQLAAKIERLEAERDGPMAVADPDTKGSDGAELPVAVLGEAGPAASAGGT